MSVRSIQSRRANNNHTSFFIFVCLDDRRSDVGARPAAPGPKRICRITQTHRSLSMRTSNNSSVRQRRHRPKQRAPRWLSGGDERRSAAPNAQKRTRHRGETERKLHRHRHEKRVSLTLFHEQCQPNRISFKSAFDAIHFKGNKFAKAFSNASLARLR